MPRIGKFPAFGKRFFRRARKLLGACRFEHFWRLVVALASMHGKRSLRRICALSGQRRTRQAVAYFLEQAHLEAPELLRLKALEALKQLGYRPGEPLFLLLDDTQKRKRGKRMAAVTKLFLHAEKVYGRGHVILCAALVYREVVIPYAVKLWASQAYCQQSQKEPKEKDRIGFCKLTELAGAMVREATLPSGAKPVVLFDAYYLCQAVLSACQERGWPFVSRAKSNRNFAPDGRPNDKRKLGKYGKSVLSRSGRWQKVSGKRHKLAERIGWLKKVGRVKVVLCQRPGEKRFVALVTNRTSWGTAKVLSSYLCRWGIEVLFKMSKQYLGLGDYQLLGYQGVVSYLHLVLIAYLLLTHLALLGTGAQAERNGHKPLRLESVPKLQEKLRALLWQDVLTHLQKGSRTQLAAQKLKEVIQY